MIFRKEFLFGFASEMFRKSNVSMYSMFQTWRNWTDYKKLLAYILITVNYKQFSELLVNPTNTVLIL